MSSLLASLSTAGNALDVYQQALSVIQNNITNASTPGFAKQSLNLVAQPFDLNGGLIGGVAARGLTSARDEYADEEVRRQLQSLGLWESRTQSTAKIENLFDVSGTSGVPANLNALFQSFSAWSVSPNSVASRQSVIANAGNLAADIQKLASSLQQTSGTIANQIDSTVSQINQLAGQIQQYNVERARQSSNDPGQDANVHAALEQLSELADISTVTQADGSITVLLSGGAPLVVGESQYAISSGLSVPSGALNQKAPPSSQILDDQGNDITSQIQGGKLGGLLDVHNRVLATILGDGQQPGSLNQFAKGFADTVNSILESGFTSSTSGAPNGTAMFVYDNSDATAAAGSFAVNPLLTTESLAPMDAQGNANGNALKLASLADSTANGSINGSTFGDYFGQITAFVGRESATAQTNQQAQEQVVAQTRSLRDQVSSVSLDEQAVQLLQFQKSYQAAARLLTTLNSIADTTIGLIAE